MTDAEKAQINAQLQSISMRLGSSTNLLKALPPVLPPAPNGTPVQTGPLIAPLKGAMDLQTTALQDLVKQLQDIVKKS